MKNLLFLLLSIGGVWLLSESSLSLRPAGLSAKIESLNQSVDEQTFEKTMVSQKLRQSYKVIHGKEMPEEYLR